MASLSLSSDSSVRYLSLFLCPSQDWNWDPMVRCYGAVVLHGCWVQHWRTELSPFPFSVEFSQISNLLSAGDLFGPPISGTSEALSDPNLLLVQWKITFCQTLMKTPFDKWWTGHDVGVSHEEWNLAKFFEMPYLRNLAVRGNVSSYVTHSPVHVEVMSGASLHPPVSQELR